MLDNIVSKYGLDEVSKRTKISKRNLEKLLKKDFNSFSKPRALGFVSILEREYGVDLADFKKEILEWFKNEDEYDISLVFPPPKEKRKRHWIAIFPLIVATLFGFYLYQNEFSKKSGLQEFKMSSPVLKEENIKNIPKDSNNSEQKEGDKTLSSDNNLSSTDNSTEESVTKDTKSYDYNNTESAYVPTQDVVVSPNVKMWIGIIDLESKKRKSRLTLENINIDSDSDKLVITGHGFFEVNDTMGNNLKFNDPNKHYLHIKDGVVKEITTKTFKELNGGKVW